MDKISFITVNEIEYAIIDKGNGEFTSMPKATYDAQAKQLTESLTPVDPAK